MLPTHQKCKLYIILSGYLFWFLAKSQYTWYIIHCDNHWRQYKTILLFMTSKHLRLNCLNSLTPVARPTVYMPSHRRCMFPQDVYPGRKYNESYYIRSRVSKLSRAQQSTLNKNTLISRTFGYAIRLRLVPCNFDHICSTMCCLAPVFYNNSVR